MQPTILNILLFVFSITSSSALFPDETDNSDRIRVLSDAPLQSESDLFEKDVLDEGVLGESVLYESIDKTETEKWLDYVQKLTVSVVESGGGVIVSGFIETSVEMFKYTTIFSSGVLSGVHIGGRLQLAEQPVQIVLIGSGLITIVVSGSLFTLTYWF